MKQRERVHTSTIIDVMRNASFFAERGIRLAQRFDYKRAIRCFRRAIELEPENAVHHYNLASVLAEIGQFEESNDILYQIIEKIDPGMVEVYFYLANNYAHLEDFQMAEEMALYYLQESKDGLYAEEAEDLLDYIYFELDLPPRRTRGFLTDTVQAKHEQARRSLEAGRFLEAIQLLKEIIEMDAKFIPAWNNLALAYYYIGDFSQAMSTIEETLERDPGNLHAICNLAVLLSHHNHLLDLTTLLDQLKKIVPLQFENTYKLATTMGILGQHEEAYRLFQRLLRCSHKLEACMYHFGAISAYMTGRIDQAVRWWKRVDRLDPEAGIGAYYLRMVKEQENGEAKINIPYHYQHPLKEVNVEKGAATADELKSDPMVRASLMWALQHGTNETKRLVLQMLALIADEEAEATLRYFIANTTVPYLKREALAILDSITEKPGVTCLQGGSQPRPIHQDQVTTLIDASFAGADQQEMRTWARKVWATYIAEKQPHGKSRKKEAWLAALEYLYAKKSGVKLTQTALAEKYSLSTQTIAKCIKELSTLDLYKF